MHRDGRQQEHAGAGTRHSGAPDMRGVAGVCAYNTVFARSHRRGAAAPRLQTCTMPVCTRAQELYTHRLHPGVGIVHAHVHADTRSWVHTHVWGLGVLYTWFIHMHSVGSPKGRYRVRLRTCLQTYTPALHEYLGLRPSSLRALQIYTGQVCTCVQGSGLLLFTA